MKKIVSLLLALMLFVTFAVTAYAAEAEEYFVIDDADILTDGEVNTLDATLIIQMYLNSEQKKESAPKLKQLFKIQK